jgi:uncharacterized repeat protein (TIGR01451 family)
MAKSCLKIMRTLTDVFTPGAPTIPEGLRTLVVSPDRELEPGMTVRAKFTFRNQGGAPATGVRVRFNVPEGLVYLVGTGQLDAIPLDDEHGNSPLLSRAGADIGDVAPGQERSIEIAYSVAGAIENGSMVELQAAVAAFELAPVGSNIVRLVARSRPALENRLTAITIESRQHEPQAGGEATITVRIHNAGESSAHDIVVVAPVPEHTTYIPNSARLNGRELERELLAPFDRVHAPLIAPTLAASATVTLQYRVRIEDPIADGTLISATALVASQETQGFDLEPAVLTVRAQPDFDDERTTFTVEPMSEVTAGSRVALRLHAYNAGTTSAEGLAVSIALPEGLVAVRGAACVDGRALRDRKNNALVYDLGPLPAREQLEFVTEATVISPLADGTQLPVHAKLRWDAPSSAGGDPCEREFERTVSVRSQPHLSGRGNRIERVGTLLVRPSDECEAILTICNDGSCAASDAVLHLHVDPALDDVRVFDKSARIIEVSSPSTASGPANLVEIGRIEPYTSRSLTIRARVRTPYADRSEIKLGASLHTQELGESHLGHAVWRVDSHPSFSTHGSSLSLVQDDVFRPNQLVDVFVRLRNEGTDVAQNVRFRVFVSPEARLESVEGATREKSTLLFGEIAPGSIVEARLGIRLLRSLAKAHPVTVDAVLTADAMLPVQFPPLTIVTTAEPNFSIGTLRSEPEELVDAGEDIEFILHVRNSGDGPARRARITVDTLGALIYVPNSTTVNDLPVRDVGAQSPLMHESGLAMSDVDPGVEATIRWREVVNNAAPSGEAIHRVARIAYDGDCLDDIAAHEVKVRCAPVFANTISGLPFGLDGMLGPSYGAHQRALTGTDFVELPPATPVTRSGEIGSRAVLSLASSMGNGHAQVETVPEHQTDAAVHGVQVVLAFDRDRLQRTLRFLSEARFSGLLTHVFAIRAFFPDSIGASGDTALHEVRETLRETLDRLFIKLRLPNYVIAPRDLETKAARAALETLLGTIAAEEAANSLAGSVVLRGACDEDELRALRDRLLETPLSTALPWATLARLIPADGEALLHYRTMLTATLDELASADEVAFIDVLQRRPYPVLDAALDVVRAQLGNTPA